MANKKLKRRHHTVPRSHLLRFSDGKQTMRVELPGTNQHRTSVNDATVENDFYLMTLADGTKSDELEDLFGEIEGLAAESVRKIVDNRVWPPPVTDRSAIAAWAALQYLRTQTQRQIIQEVTDTALKTLIARGGREQIRQAIEYAEGRPAIAEEVDESWRRLTDFDNYTITSGNSPHLTVLGNLLEPTTGRFFDRSWQIIRFTRRTLTTSDSPVVLIPEPDITPTRGVGLATAAAILVPLDRRVGLLMTAPGTPDTAIPGTTMLAKEFNHRIATQARRAIFHHPDDDPLDGIELPEPREQLIRSVDPAKLVEEDGGVEDDTLQ